MSRLAALVLLALGVVAGDVSAQQDQVRNDWMLIHGAKGKAEGASLIVERGVVFSSRFLADVVIEFDSRGLDDRSRASLWLHGLVSDSGRSGYQVALVPGRSGRPVPGVRAAGATLTPIETGATPAPATTGAWRHVAASLRNGELSVAVDGVRLIRAEKLSRVTGHVGFETSGGKGIEIRDFRAAKVPGDPLRDDFGGTPSVGLGTGITMPELQREVKPSYTASAMHRKIEGTVSIEAIVTESGVVGSPRVIDSLDAGLDEKALEAVLRWRFKPAVRDGQPIAVRVVFVLDFRLAE